jgi:4-hydroxy-3-methylbut-2-enyl diphosphate reductase
MDEGLVPLRVILAQPRGFCAGVVRAVDIVERALAAYGPPVYVRHQIVHNRHVVERLKGRGAVFVEAIDEIPFGALTIFSAHGVSQAVARQAEARRLDVIDATCPLVERVHKEVRRYAARGYEILLIGHDGHVEVEGTRGQIENGIHLVASREAVMTLQLADPQRVAYVTQTTLSLLDTKEIIAAIKGRFPHAVGPETRDICYATQNRQLAVMAMLAEVQLLLVLGAPNSSNSNRLREIGAASGIASHLIESAEDFDLAWLAGVATLGLTAGASAPEHLVETTLARLARHRALSIETLAGGEEKVQFRLPPRLVDRGKVESRVPDSDALAHAGLRGTAVDESTATATFG